MTPRLSRRSGFTLAEVMVATGIFAIVVLAAFALYDLSTGQYRAGEQAMDAQQNSRVAFDQLISDLRMTGFDVNRTGENQGEVADEKVEGIWKRAIAIRANFNYKDPDIAGVRENYGREIPYENTASVPPTGQVTSANEEIIVYALRSMGGGVALNSDSISVHLDNSKPRDGAISTVTLTGIDLTGANPPYELIKTWIGPNTGDGFVTPVVVAQNLVDMTFTYFREGETLAMTDAAVASISNTTDAADVTLAINGVNVTETAKTWRKQLHLIRLGLIGATPNDDPRYTDPKPGALLPKRRKFYLTADALIRNMVFDGDLDTDTNPPAPPTNVTICGGNCEAMTVRWTPSVSPSAVVYEVCWDTNPNPRTNCTQIFGHGSGEYTLDVGIVGGQTYYVSMRALDAFEPPNSSSWVDSSPTSYSVPLTDTIKPDKVTGVTAQATDAQSAGTANGSGPARNVRVKWDPVLYNAVGSSNACDTLTNGRVPYRDHQGYRVYRKSFSSCLMTAPPFGFGTFPIDGSDPAVRLVADENETLSSTEYIDTTAPACAASFYRVIAVDKCGNKSVDSSGNVAPSDPMTTPVVTQGDPSRLPLAPRVAVIPVPPDFTGFPTPMFSPGSYVNIPLAWATVDQDNSSPPQKIGVDQYRVEIRPLVGGVLQAPAYATVCPAFEPSTAISPGLHRWQFQVPGPEFPVSAASINWQAVQFRVQAVLPCTPPIKDDVDGWSEPVVWPCALPVTRFYSLRGNGGGVHQTILPAAFSSSSNPLMGESLTLEIDASPYTKPVAAGGMNVGVSQILITSPFSNGQSVISPSQWIADTANPPGCPAGSLSCTFRFTAPMSGLSMTSGPDSTYSMSYQVELPGQVCPADMVLIRDVWVNATNACILKTQCNTPQIPRPKAVAAGGATSPNRLQMYVARSDGAAANNIRVAFTKLALQWDENGVVTLPLLQSVDLVNETQGQTVANILTSTSGISVYRRQLAPSQNLTFVTVPPGVEILDNDLYRFDFTFNGPITATGGSPIGAHPGFNASFGFKPIATNGMLGSERWCAADLSNVLVHNPPSQPQYFDDYWKACSATNCPNPDPQTPSGFCPPPL